MKNKTQEQLDALRTTKEKTKHTPGPWTAVEGRNGFLDALNYVHDGKRCIARMELADGDTSFQRARTMANARLIAAAPDLLEAAKRALALVECLPGRDIHGNQATHTLDTEDVLRAAIAKAEGK